VTSMSDLQLLQLQAEALFTHDGRGRILHTNEPEGDRAPRFFFAHSREGNLWRCRDDVPKEMVRALDALAAAEPVGVDLRAEPRNVGAFLTALGVEREGAPVESGPAYQFPDELPRAAGVTHLTRDNLHLLRAMVQDLDYTARYFEERGPCMAVVEDGRAVSICFSARLTDKAAEAGVETLEAYRGRGYAPAVVTEWARAIRATGRIPLYSTSWDNHASQAVARRFRLVHYGTDVSLG
jgi:GNAT superfamily N-acetyltransferase